MESLNSYTSWLSARCPRPPGKREISKWTKIWWIFLGHALFAGRIWEEDISTAEVEELKKLEASEIYPRRLNAKEVLITQKDGELVISCGRWFCKITRKRLRIPRTLSEAGVHRKERESQRRISRRQGRVSTWRISAWRRSSERLWSIQENFIYYHHFESRVQLLYLPRKESFLIWQDLHH